VRRNLQAVRALMRRGLNEILRVPIAALPGILAPTIFLLGMAAIFGKAASLEEYGGVSFLAFLLPVGMLQGAGFTGAATGVNLARDIEGGWFDRMLLAPTPRPVLLAGVVASASLRALLPATFLLAVALALGVDWPGMLEVALAAVLVMGLAAAVACYATLIALRFRTQQAAPLMQMGSFIAVLFTTSYAPRELLADWLRVIADLNPVTHVLEGVRQGFVGDVTWATTWPALVSITGLVLVFGALAVRGMSRQGL
jgi:ABC-type multidrug transport system permease subunit